MSETTPEIYGDSRLTEAERQLPYLYMDEEDAQIIVAELHGRLAKAFVYEFDQKGTTIRGLTIVGVREAVSILHSQGKADITIVPEHLRIDEDANNYTVTAYALDRVRNVGMYGTASEVKTGKFYRSIAMSKAQRNAMRQLLPQLFIEEMTDAFSKTNLRRLDAEDRELRLAREQQAKVTASRNTKQIAPAKPATPLTTPTYTRDAVLDIFTSHYDSIEPAGKPPQQININAVLATCSKVAGSQVGELYAFLGLDPEALSRQSYGALYKLINSPDAPSMVAAVLA